MGRDREARLSGVPRRLHLVGIGGAGMSALAKVLLARGATVSGSDIKTSRGLAALEALGARVAVGHRRSNVGEVDAVVVSSAVRPGNPETRAARERGIPVLHRAQVLAMLIRAGRGIAIAGTHGKTTTTSMVARVLQGAGLDPTFLIGGDLNETGTNAHHGAGEWIVAEADESDGSLLWLAPEIAVVTNVEADHLDHYSGEDEIRETFRAFLAGVRPEGAILVCADDPGARALAGSPGVGTQLARPLITYGLERGEWRGRVTGAGRGGLRLSVSRDGAALGEVQLAVAGRHNARNALAALAVADLCGIPLPVAAAQLAGFQGVQRRFQFRGTAGGVAVVDDYAHHPTEVSATLDAARELGYRRILAVFQPHLYSRTAALGAGLGAALAAADGVVVIDVYGAREEPQPGVTGMLVVQGCLAAVPRRRVAYLPKRGDVAAYVAAQAAPGDLVLTIGAGDVTMLADEILRALDAAGGASRPA